MVLSIILAVLLAAPTLAPSALVGAVSHPDATREKPAAPSAAPKTPKQPQSPVVTTSRHGAQKVRSAQTKPADKKQDNVVTENRGTIDPIAAVGRGQTIDISGTALRTGQACVFRLFYADKKGPVIRDVVPDEKKRCTASVTIPDRPGVVGDASVVLLFNNKSSGKHAGSARQTFTIS
jgi:hypothetical protein